MRVAMTGATGAVGSAFSSALEARGHVVDRIGRRTVLRWDLHDAISAELRQAFERSDVVVHAAADIRLGAPRAELLSVNVSAVERLVDALRTLSDPPRLVHVSSAFAERIDDRPHNNFYEESKLLSEQVVMASGLNASILRPSLVIGSSVDGTIGRYSGIYIFLRMLRLGLVPAIPGFGDIRVDIVPVDKVVALGVALVEAELGDTRVGATSGPAAPTLRELVDAVYEVIEEEIGEQIDHPKFVKPEVYHRLFRPVVEEELSSAQRVLLDTVEIFLPYFERDHVFATHLDLRADEVLDAWRASTRHWLADAGAGQARGKAVWAKHSQ